MRPTRNPIAAALAAADHDAAVARAVALIHAAFPGTVELSDEQAAADARNLRRVERVAGTLHLRSLS